MDGIGCARPYYPFMKSTNNDLVKIEREGIGKLTHKGDVARITTSWECAVRCVTSAWERVILKKKKIGEFWG